MISTEGKLLLIRENIFGYFATLFLYKISEYTNNTNNKINSAMHIKIE